MRDRLLDGRPPTVREVRDALGFRAVESARAHLLALVEDGRLVKKPGRARGYALPESEGQRGVPRLVPLLGRVPAGPTDLAVEDVERYLPSRSASNDEMFALRVRGDSMRNAGIMDGDVVIVRRQPTASSGSIVVALIGDEATVKTLHVHDGNGSGRSHRGRIELRPENPDYQPIIPDPEEVQILGKVVEVRRFLEGGI
jgi:repressor LexA